MRKYFIIRFTCRNYTFHVNQIKNQISARPFFTYTTFLIDSNLTDRFEHDQLEFLAELSNISHFHIILNMHHMKVTDLRTDHAKVISIVT